MNSDTLRSIAKKYPGDILKPYDDIMNMDGFDAICAFSEYLSGRTIYIPSKKTIFIRCLERAAQKDFDGTNFPILTRRYGLSERHLRRVLGYK
jgi:Mor family transcriptional regulator